jgi:hypothetical protein
MAVHLNRRGTENRRGTSTLGRLRIGPSLGKAISARATIQFSEKQKKIQWVPPKDLEDLSSDDLSKGVFVSTKRVVVAYNRAAFPWRRIVGVTRFG